MSKRLFTKEERKLLWKDTQRANFASANQVRKAIKEGNWNTIEKDNSIVVSPNQKKAIGFSR